MAAARWQYRARAADGREQRGELTAGSESEAVAALRARSLWVIELAPQFAVPTPDADSARGSASGHGGGSAGGASAVGTAVATTSSAASASFGRWLARWSGRELEQLAVVTRTVATLLAAGVPVDQALSHAARSGDDATAAQWRTVFGTLAARVQRGESLSTAAGASPTLPPGFAPALAAAEASGTLAPTMERLASHLERRARTEQAVRSALVYPTILGLASIVGTLVILVVVVPRFAGLLADTGIPLPWATRLLMGAGTLVARFGWILLGGAIAAALALRSALAAPDRRRQWHAARLTWPLVGPFERDREASRYLDTLAMALEAGVPLLRAMRLARDAVQNVALAAAFEPAEAAVRDGGSVAAAVAALLPPLTVRLLDAGESAGALPALARRAADAADAAAQRRLTALVTLIEPVLILGFGGIVGLVALALLQAIYGLNAGALS